MGNRHPQRIKCRATSKRTGLPCGNWARVGALVCKFHGAGGDSSNPEHSGAYKAGQRVRAAEDELKEKLFAMHQDALDAVTDVLTNPEAKDADKLRAADTVLNRFVPQRAETKVQVDTSEERDLDAEIASALGVELPDADAG